MRILIAFCITLLTFSACSEMDNYDEANGSISGAIYDIKSKESGTKVLVPGQSPDGARIRIYENNSSQPISFWAKSDGTFVNTKIFSGKYRVIAEGPFIILPEDTIRTDLPTSTEVAFYVEPFMRIVASASLGTDKIDVKFKLSRSSKVNRKMNKYAILYSNTQHIDVNAYKFRKEYNVEESSEAGLLDVEQIFTLNEVVKDKDGNGVVQYEKNKPIYIRVAARTSGTDYYNYSEVIKIQ